MERLSTENAVMYLLSLIFQIKDLLVRYFFCNFAGDF